MPFVADPRLPSAAALALRAAALAFPALVWTLGHDLCIHAAVGQLLPLTGLEPGTYLLDRPIPTPKRRDVITAAVRALLGEPRWYEVPMHDRTWLTTMEPIWDHAEPDPTRQVRGVLATSVLTDVPAVVADEPPVGTFCAVAEDHEVRRGDIVTLREGEPIYRHTPMGQDRFDQLLARGILMQCDPSPCAPSGALVAERPARAAPRAGGRARRLRLRLHLA